MRDLAKGKHTPVVEAIPNPSPKRALANRGILPATFDLDGFGNTPEGPFNSVGFDNFIRLPGVCNVKSGADIHPPHFTQQ